MLNSILQPIIDTAALDTKATEAMDTSDAAYAALREGLLSTVSCLSNCWPHPLTGVVAGLLVQTSMWTEAQELMRVLAEGEVAAKALTSPLRGTPRAFDEFHNAFDNALRAQETALQSATDALLRWGPEPLVKAFVSVLLEHHGHIGRAQELLSLTVACAESAQASNDAMMAAAVGKWETELTTGEPAYLNAEA